MVALLPAARGAIRAGAHRVELRHVPSWQLAAPNRNAGTVIHAVAWLGPNEVEKSLDAVLPTLSGEDLSELSGRRRPRCMSTASGTRPRQALVEAWHDLASISRTQGSRHGLCRTANSLCRSPATLRRYLMSVQRAVARAEVEGIGRWPLDARLSSPEISFTLAHYLRQRGSGRRRTIRLSQVLGAGLVR